MYRNWQTLEVQLDVQKLTETGCTTTGCTETEGTEMVVQKLDHKIICKK